MNTCGGQDVHGSSHGSGRGNGGGSGHDGGGGITVEVMVEEAVVAVEVNKVYLAAIKPFPELFLETNLSNS